MIAGAVGFIIYGWFVLVPPFYGNTSPFNFLEEWFGKTIDDFLSVWNRIILQVTGFFAVAGILGIIVWIGYTRVTTPSPASLEDLDEETENIELVEA